MNTQLVLKKRNFDDCADPELARAAFACELRRIIAEVAGGEVAEGTTAAEENKAGPGPGNSLGTGCN